MQKEGSILKLSELGAGGLANDALCEYHSGNNSIIFALKDVPEKNITYKEDFKHLHTGLSRFIFQIFLLVCS